MTAAATALCFPDHSHTLPLAGTLSEPTAARTNHERPSQELLVAEAPWDHLHRCLVTAIPRHILRWTSLLAKLFGKTTTITITARNLLEFPHRA
jgi:hypothetical protein